LPANYFLNKINIDSGSEDGAVERKIQVQIDGCLI